MWSKPEFGLERRRRRAIIPAPFASLESGHKKVYSMTHSPSQIKGFRQICAIADIIISFVLGCIRLDWDRAEALPGVETIFIEDNRGR